MEENIRKKIILTADDFGISKVANKKVLELVRLRKINRVSVMVNGIFSQEEVDELLNSEIKLDVHFNITEKFSGPRKIKEGIIKCSALFLIRYIGGQMSVSKVKKEWEQQVNKFKEVIGKYPDGINSHQHVHYYPSYFKIASKLSKKYSISFIRCGKKGFLGKMNGVKQILAVFRKSDEKCLVKNNIESSDYLVSLDWIKDFNKFLNNLPQGSTEITFHPEREEEFNFVKNCF